MERHRQLASITELAHKKRDDADVMKWLVAGARCHLIEFDDVGVMGRLKSIPGPYTHYFVPGFILLCTPSCLAPRDARFEFISGVGTGRRRGSRRDRLEITLIAETQLV